jgi:hypothetical protein
VFFSRSERSANENVFNHDVAIRSEKQADADDALARMSAPQVQVPNGIPAGRHARDRVRDKRGMVDPNRIDRRLSVRVACPGQGSLLYDRYCLPVLPLFVLAILLVWQHRHRQTPWLFAWIALAVFACYGVAITHDHFAQSAARLRASRILQADGIPQERILAGFENDMWTQVALEGNLHKPAPPAGLSIHEPPVWYLSQTPRIKPAYYLTSILLPHMRSCKSQPVGYSAWLSPRDRHIWILCPD